MATPRNLLSEPHASTGATAAASAMTARHRAAVLGEEAAAIGAARMATAALK